MHTAALHHTCFKDVQALLNNIDLDQASLSCGHIFDTFIDIGSQESLKGYCKSNDYIGSIYFSDMIEQQWLILYSSKVHKYIYR